MLKSLQKILAVATVVRDDTVIGAVDHIEIDECGVYIVLEDDPETPEGGGNEVFYFDAAEIVRRKSS